MFSMDLDVVLQDLNRRFAAPLPEFYLRRIIFWYDEDREFGDVIDQVQLNNAKIAILNGSNTFAIKKLLCEDDVTSNYLVYQPLSFDKDDDNWLINVQLYSEEFRADLNSMWMNEMGLPSTPVIRRQVKQYRKFFNAKGRRDAVAKLNNNITTAPQIHLTVMAAICGNSDTLPNNIIRSVIKAGIKLEENEIYQSFVNYGADTAFWMMVAQATGYNDGDTPSIEKLAVHILLTAATRTMHMDNFSGLGSFISSPHQAYCYDLVSDWMNSDDNNMLYEIARIAEDKLFLTRRFSKLLLEDLCETGCFPCINEIILTSLMTDIKNQIINVDRIRTITEKRRSLVWYDEVSCYYDGLLQVANMQQFYLEHSAGFHIVEPYKVWRAYTEDYFKMDTYYRQFHLCFQKCLKISNPLLDDLFKSVVDVVESIYLNWFLANLGENWTNVCEDSLAEYGRVMEIPQQVNFYRDKVRNAENRVFVIISDALRYEIAASLAEQLKRETQSKVKLSSCEAVFPTTTKYGMSALLPHKKLEVAEKVNGALNILADGIPTDANYRDKILKNENQNSVALKYNNIIGLKRAERQALVKGMDVVYIYHDKVDEASHTSDSAVFPACDDAITEIKNLVRIIVNEFSGTRIYITADHGFLYTYSPLKEDDKVDKGASTNRIVEYGRRFAIMQKDTNPDFLMPIKFMDGETNYQAYAPRENIRIKMSGGGLNYVHGGTSLQEMVVPIVEYQHLRNSSKEYQRNKNKIDTKPVVVNLLSANRKISNMIFSLNFYQTEAVGGNREAATYLVYFVDANNQQVSDTAKIIADKTNANGQERTFRCNFNLRSQKYNNRDSYYLVIADESGLQMPVKEEFQIDIAFAVDDFGFF